MAKCVSCGVVWRVSATLSCPMTLHKFPLDTQTCPMMFESCEYRVFILVANTHNTELITITELHILCFNCSIAAHFLIQNFTTNGMASSVTRLGNVLSLMTFVCDCNKPHYCLSNAMHKQNINLPVCVCLSVCSSHFLSTRLQVRPFNGFLQIA